MFTLTFITFYNYKVIGDRNSVVRVLVCESKSYGFKSRRSPKMLYINLKKSLISEEVLPILLIILVSFTLAIIILSLSYFLSVQNPETEKLSAYECGFEPYEDTRNKFNLNFYIIAILFIVFDIEAMFLFSWCVSLSSLDLIGFWSMIDFIIELGVGFLYVLYIGALDWE